MHMKHWKMISSDINLKCKNKINNDCDNISLELWVWIISDEIKYFKLKNQFLLSTSYFKIDKGFYI